MLLASSTTVPTFCNTPLSLRFVSTRRPITDKTNCCARRLGQPRNVIVICSRRPESTYSRPAINLLPTTVYTAYLTRLFIFPPVPLSFQQSLHEAFDLSLNFAYVTPVVFPQLAPVLHPLLEALFHVVVAWALLLLGFAARDAYLPRATPRITPFLIAALFLTNIVYMPYLCVCQRTDGIPANDDDGDKGLQTSKVSTQLDSRKRSTLVNFAESRSLPLLAGVITAISIPWGLFARMGTYGDLHARWETFWPLLSSQDILAYSFALDVVVFALFQWALVDDDAQARQWSSESLKRWAVAGAKFVPFVGLLAYLFVRSREAPLEWADE